MEEFHIKRAAPGHGPEDGVECNTTGTRTTQVTGNQKHKMIPVNVKASLSLGVVSIGDPGKDMVIGISITEMAAILNEALRAGAEKGRSRDNGKL